MRLLTLMFLFGASSGLPLSAASGTLAAWMKNDGISVSTIGLFALTGLPYAYKVLWAPFMDRYHFGSLGRRRSWMYLTQVALILSLLAVSFQNPTQTPMALASLAVAISFFSASQDIVLDAYRRDILSSEQLGLGSSLFVAGYRIGLLLSGALALSLSTTIGWHQVYIFLAGCMCLGLVCTLICEEPPESISSAPKTLHDSIVEPLKDFFSRPYFYEIILFVLLYKLGDTLAAALSGPFILDIGYSNVQLGLVGKTFGLTSAIVGGIIGGAYIPKLGLGRSLAIFGVIQLIGIIPFSILATLPYNIYYLATAVSLENLTSGLGTAAFMTFLAELCNKKFSATQYALLTSIVALPRTLLASGTGFVAEQTGWFLYFILCAASAIPGLILLFRYTIWKIAPSPN